MELHAMRRISGAKAVLRCVFLLGCLSASVVSASLPIELKAGMVRFDLESGNYFRALVEMDAAFRKEHPVLFAEALHGFGITEEAEKLIAAIYKSGRELTPDERFRLGRIEHKLGQCRESLRTLKDLRNKIHPEEHQEWAYYRASCSLQLGGNEYAAKALAGELGGLWVAYGYYNLGMSYLASSTDIKRAVLALRVASDINPGKTRQERELNDRINLAAGAVYLREKSPDSALEFLKKVHLDSAVASQALYLTGVAYHETSNFRAATQNWVKVQSYPTISRGASEALLAIPYAYEGAGYVGQALDAYVSASDVFKGELETVAKIRDAIKKYSAQRVLLEEDSIAELEWFLKKDVAKNTPRATYYQYLMDDKAIFSAVELLKEMLLLEGTLDFWSAQLGVFDVSLKRKQRDFSVKKARLSPASVTTKVQVLDQRFQQALEQSERLQLPQRHLGIEEIERGLGDLRDRLARMDGMLNQGANQLGRQLDTSHKLNQRMSAVRSRLKRTTDELNSEMTAMVLQRLSDLEQTIMFNFERAEQGLIHIMEGIAESKADKRHNPLDGRYR